MREDTITFNAADILISRGHLVLASSVFLETLERADRSVQLRTTENQSR